MIFANSVPTATRTLNMSRSGFKGGNSNRNSNGGYKGGASKSYSRQPTSESAPTAGDLEIRPATTSFFSDLNPRLAKQFLSEAAYNGNGKDDKKATQTSEEEAIADFAHTGHTDNTNQLQDTVLWVEMGLCKALVRAVGQLGYLSPTPVQVATIPHAIRGLDICMRAVTGSGKTAAFLLPTIHAIVTKPSKKQVMGNTKRKFIRAIVLVPTRELGAQCEAMARQLCLFTSDISVSLAIGGMANKSQEAVLDQAPDLVIATPGRLCDVLLNFKGVSGKGYAKGIDLSGVEVCVLDECDKLLSTQLKDQVETVLGRTDETMRQLMLVSATMTKDVDDFAKQYLYKPKNIDIGHVALATQLKQQFIRIKTDVEDIKPEDVIEAPKTGGRANGRQARKRQREDGKDDDPDDPSDKEDEGVNQHTIDNHISRVKTQHLVAICKSVFTNSTLIFTKYKTTAHRLNAVFQLLGMKSEELQGNQTQEERLESLRRFTAGEAQFLFSTDVSSRGLDIRGVNIVINFDMPPTLTTYIHRVGRTARIGDHGTAVSLVHEVQDADIMRKVITLSSKINDHQVASVKRRDIPADQLEEARKLVDDIFPEVRDLLSAEELEAKIDKAQRRISSATAMMDTLAESITAKPKRAWCLTKDEQRRRAIENREKYVKEAEMVEAQMADEMRDLEKEQQAFLKQQKAERARDRDVKERKYESEMRSAKEQRKKAAEKLKGGVVKKLKMAKIRKAKQEQRSEARMAKGGKSIKRKSKVSKQKSRHAGRQKKH